MHPCPGNWVAIERAVVYYWPSSRAFSAGITCVNCSLLKLDDCMLWSTSSNTWCTVCDRDCDDDVNHLIIQCPATKDLRVKTFDQIKQMEDDFGKLVLRDPTKIRDTQFCANPMELV